MFRTWPKKMYSNVTLLRTSGILGLPHVDVFVGLPCNTVIEKDNGLNQWLGYDLEQMWAQDASRDLFKWDWIGYDGERTLVLDGFDPIANLIPRRGVEKVVNGEEIASFVEPGWVNVWICTPHFPWDWYGQEQWNIMKSGWIVDVWREHINGDIVRVDDPEE